MVHEGEEGVLMGVNEERRSEVQGCHVRTKNDLSDT